MRVLIQIILCLVVSFHNYSLKGNTQILNGSIINRDEDKVVDFISIILDGHNLGDVRVISINYDLEVHFNEDFNDFKLRLYNSPKRLNIDYNYINSFRAKRLKGTDYKFINLRRAIGLDPFKPEVEIQRVLFEELKYMWLCYQNNQYDPFDVKGDYDYGGSPEKPIKFTFPHDFSSPGDVTKIKVNSSRTIQIETPVQNAKSKGYYISQTGEKLLLEKDKIKNNISLKIVYDKSDGNYYYHEDKNTADYTNGSESRIVDIESIFSISLLILIVILIVYVTIKIVLSYIK